MLTTIVVGLSALLLLVIISEISYETNRPINREDLEEVVSSNTDCAKYWRLEILAMWNNKTHDYKNDPIFQECYKALESQKNNQE